MENKEQKTNSIRLLFARHGETEANFTGVICGQQPGKLTTLGEKQAQKIGVYFSKENITFDYIYVSDLARTVATFNNCKSRAQHLEKVETKFIPLIRERSGGILEGQPLNIWKENAEKQGLDVRVYKCEKGESWCDVNTRCFAFLKLLVQEHLLNKNNDKETRIFAVVHQGFLMEFYNLMRMLHGEEPQFKAVAKNCSLHEFLIEYPQEEKEYIKEKVQIQCTLNNSVDHLQLAL